MMSNSVDFLCRTSWDTRINNEIHTAFWAITSRRIFLVAIATHRAIILSASVTRRGWLGRVLS